MGSIPTLRTHFKEVDHAHMSDGKEKLWKGNQVALDEAREGYMTYMQWALELGFARDLEDISAGKLHSITSAVTGFAREIERFEKIIATKQQNESGNKIVLEWAKPGEHSTQA